MPPFVVLSQPRAGSDHLVALLASAPDIVCHGDIFKARRVELAPPELEALGIAAEDVASRDADPMAFVERLRALAPPTSIFGFRLLQKQAIAHKPLRHDVLLAPSWRKVILLRDPVQTYTAILRAQQERVSAPSAGDEPAADAPQAPVRFEQAGFERHLDDRARFLRQVEVIEAVAGNPVLRIDYDVLLRGDDLAATLRFLGSTAASETVRETLPRKQSTDPRPGFSNWPEFEAYLGAHGITAPDAGKTHDS